MADESPENIAAAELERIAQHGDLDELNACLKTHPLWVPRKPRRFIDPVGLTKDQLFEKIRIDLEELKKEPFVPWILELDGKRRLPVFSSRQRMAAFRTHITKDLKQAFGLVCVTILFADILKRADIDSVDLNLFTENGREIGVRRRGM